MHYIDDTVATTEPITESRLAALQAEMSKLEVHGALREFMVNTDNGYNGTQTRHMREESVCTAESGSSQESVPPLASLSVTTDSYSDQQEEFIGMINIEEGDNGYVSDSSTGSHIVRVTQTILSYGCGDFGRKQKPAFNAVILFLHQQK